MSRASTPVRLERVLMKLRRSLADWGRACPGQPGYHCSVPQNSRSRGQACDDAGTKVPYWMPISGQYNCTSPSSTTNSTTVSHQPSRTRSRASK